MKNYHKLRGDKTLSYNPELINITSNGIVFQTTEKNSRLEIQDDVVGNNLATIVEGGA